jgi:transcriptional regulator with GAF, ATPase, and Fis domain
VAAEQLIGERSGLSGVIDRVEMVSRSNAPVLLFGETGTGKEVVARLVHQQSGFRHGPFRRVNCGAIPTELIDSELFGHEKGAFTGALTQRQGWFEQADGGTLFLDEIGELSLAAQVRLLRVVQDSEVVRVGGERPIRVKIRLVAATHRDLPEMVEAKAFRDDLYYRLAVFPIVIPPLRDRPEDVRPFAEYFARRASDRFGVRPVAVSDEDVRLLTDYPWPGNVREMSAVMDRAVLLGQGQTLEVAAALGRGVGPRAAAPATPGAAVPRETGLVSLDEAIRRHIEAALTETRGRVEGKHGAARLLRVNPHTLRARMRKLGIDWATFRDPADPA